jgi:hypothetical protein
MADGVEEAPIFRDHSGRVGQLDALRSPIRAAGIRGRGFLVTRPRGHAAIVRPMARVVTYVDAERVDICTCLILASGRVVTNEAKPGPDDGRHRPADGGRGDVPLVRLRRRCARCKSDRIDMVATSHARVVPWVN